MCIPAEDTFPVLNTGYNATFKPGRLSIGLVMPVEAYVDGAVPQLKRHTKRVQLAESLGFSAIWLRDVPFNVPSFGDAGQVFDPFVYLGLLAGKTRSIALGVASIILPLRHPAHVAKAAASADVLSEGRLLLGVASGDRPSEYPALNIPFHERGERFRNSYDYIRFMAERQPEFDNPLGNVNHDGWDRGIDMLPKPVAGRLPLLVTGGSQQDDQWIAGHGDGWMLYPRNIPLQERIIGEWREKVWKMRDAVLPVMQPLYFDFLGEPNATAEPIHLGIRSGLDFLREYLRALQKIGVNHVALNLRFNRADIETTLHALAQEVLPEFHS